MTLFPLNLTNFFPYGPAVKYFVMKPLQVKKLLCVCISDSKSQEAVNICA